MQKTQGQTGAATSQFVDRISAMLREHGGIAAILLLGFVMRLIFSGTKSYWYDEILSVVIFGIENKSGAEVLERISHEMQPPLHQIILYYWMVLFGDGEVVTRTLSNLYVAGATFCLYILTLRLYRPRVAIATALIFSLMFIPIYYAMETRCYAQVLFLVSLSSLLLYDFLCRQPEPLSWGALLRDGRLYALVLVNFALTLTHYYTVFFLGAQGIFLLAYLLVRVRGRNLVSIAVKTAAIAAAPLLLLLITWGPVMAANYGLFKSKPDFMVIGLPPDPFSIFFDMVAQPNLASPAFALSVMAVLLSLRLARAGTVIRRGEVADVCLFRLLFRNRRLGALRAGFFDLSHLRPSALFAALLRVLHAAARRAFGTVGRRGGAPDQWPRLPREQPVGSALPSVGGADRLAGVTVGRVAGRA